MIILRVFYISYLLLLALYPCSDSCVSSDATEFAFYAASEQHGQPVLDICTPFCTCACCHTAPFQSVNPITFSLEIPYQALTPHYASSFIKELSQTIWQPPKLS